ncbi:ankyrin repeat protein [Cladorrhinum sp. PSN332]|nr:ankyrin repeat protein [Cladorrhinum sp. PSN332]
MLVAVIALIWAFPKPATAADGMEFANNLFSDLVPPHGYLLTCAGTIGVCLGTFLCALVVESSTEEETWEAAAPEKQSFGVMWLQRGQVVGDQAFRSFAIYDTLHEQRIRISHKSTAPKSIELLALLGSILTVTGNDSGAVVDQLCQGIENVLNHIYQPNGNLRIKPDLQHQTTFEWRLGVTTKISGSNNDSACGDLNITLRRSKTDDKWAPWRVRPQDIEAALSLWLLHFWRPDFVPSRNLWIIGSNSPANRLVYDWWIFRGTHRTNIESVADACRQHRVSKDRVFDPFVSQQMSPAKGFIGTVTSDDLPRICSHFILQCFLKSAISGVEKLEGKTGISVGATPGQFLLVNDSVRGISEALQQSGLVSIEGSYRLVVPALDDAEVLPDAFDILEDIDRWADAGKTFLRLLDSLSSHLGPQASPTVRAKAAMEQFAIDFVESSTTASASAKSRTADFAEPFRLHAASAKGLIGQLLRALLEGAGVDTWDDEHETPISLAIQHGHIDIVRLAIFYGAPVDRELLAVAIDDNGNTLYPNGDEIVRVLLLNLKDQTGVLLEASEKNYGMVQLLLDTGIDVTVQDSRGFMPLHLASINGCDQAVEVLLANGADTSAQTPDGLTPLHLAVENRRLGSINLLLKAGAGTEARDKKKRTPLHIAAAKGYVNIVSNLLENGADPNGAQEDGRTALHIAAEENATGMIACLLKYPGLQLDAKDQDQATALHLASYSGDSEAVGMLASAGPAMVHAKNKYGRTPLVHASHRNGRVSVVQVLLDNGSDLASREDSGRSSLEWAACEGYLPIVRLLIEKGAPLTNKDGFGRMAIHYAAMGKHLEVVRLLAESGAAVDATDKDGWTALHYAYCTHSQEVVSLLLEKGLNPLQQDRLGRAAESYWADSREVHFWARALPPPYPKASHYDSVEL